MCQRLRKGPLNLAPSLSLLIVLTLQAAPGVPVSQRGLAQNRYAAERVQVADAIAVQITGMNRRGHLLGWYIPKGTESGVANAFLWRDHKVIDLGISVRMPHQRGWCINDSDVIVGTRELGRGKTTAFIHKDGVTSDIPGLESASGINNAGNVIGFASDDPDHYGRPVLWQNGKLTRIIDTSNRFATYRLNAINSSNEVAGMVLDSDIGPYTAFRWKDGIFTRLPGLGGSSGSAMAINDHGTLTGYSSDETGKYVGVTWHNDRLQNSSKYALAKDINNHGHRVGVSNQHACIFLCNSVLDLQSVPKLLPITQNSESVAINDRGQIAVNGDTWAVLLTPTHLDTKHE